MSSIPDMGIFGDNVEVRVFINGQPPGGPEYATSIKIKQEATIHKRNHLGRKRQRIGKQVDSYTINLAMDLATTRLMDKLRERDTKRDQNLSVPDLTLSFKFTLRTGQEAVYTATKCEESNDIDASDRNQEVQFNVEISAEDVRKVL